VVLLFIRSFNRPRKEVITTEAEMSQQFITPLCLNAFSPCGEEDTIIIIDQEHGTTIRVKKVKDTLVIDCQPIEVAVEQEVVMSARAGAATFIVR